MTYLVNDYKFCRFGELWQINRNSNHCSWIPPNWKAFPKSPSLCVISGLLFSTMPSFTNKPSEWVSTGDESRTTKNFEDPPGKWIFFFLQIVTWLRSHQEKRAVLTPTAHLHSLPLIVEQWEKLLNLQFYSVHNFPPKVTVILRLLRFMELTIGYFQSEF